MKKQSDQGLPCSLFCQAFCEITALTTHILFENRREKSVQNFITFTVHREIFLLAGGGDGGSSGGGVWVSGRNEGFAMVRMTCSDVAFRAATASSCVTFSKLLSFTCTYNNT